MSEALREQVRLGAMDKSTRAGAAPAVMEGGIREARMERREFLKWLGAAAALALPGSGANAAVDRGSLGAASRHGARISEFAGAGRIPASTTAWPPPHSPAPVFSVDAFAACHGHRFAADGHGRI